MKMLDIDGDLVNVDVKPSSYPIKHVSKSALQGKTGEFLQTAFPHSNILEEFPVPGSAFHVDYFVPDRKLVIEVNGIGHDKFTPFFHGNKETSNKFAKQVRRDSLVQNWADNNGFKLVEIRTEKDLASILEASKRSVL